MAGSGSQSVFLEGAQLLKDLAIESPRVGLLTWSRHCAVRTLAFDALGGDLHIRSESSWLDLVLICVRFFQLFWWVRAPLAIICRWALCSILCCVVVYVGHGHWIQVS